MIENGDMEECSESQQELPESPRRRARAVALQVLYAVDSSRHPHEEVLHWTSEEGDLPPDSQSFARGLVEGVLDNLEKVDDARVLEVGRDDANRSRVAFADLMTDDESAKSLV